MLNITNHQGNANQNYNEIPPLSLGWLPPKKQKTSTGKNEEKLQPLCTVNGNVIGIATEETIWQFHKKIKNRITI